MPNPLSPNAALVMSVLLSATAAQGQTTPPATADATAINLGAAVTSLLANNTDVNLAAVEAELARGALLVAGEPFDPTLTSTASGTQEQSFDERPDRAVEVRRLDLAAGLTQRFRAGVVVSPEATAERTLVKGDPDTTVTAAGARLRVLLPLLRDRRGILTEGPEQSARRVHAASLLEVRHAAALGVFRAAGAYWDYLASQRRLAVFGSSESRAERTARDTGALVKADERTRTDQVQAEGHLAARRADRIAAEQDVVNAWETLATVMGVVGTQALSPPVAGTDFPAAEQVPSRDSLQRWLATAASRDDLLAARWRVGGTEAAERAARSELLPRLDLELSAGYKGQERNQGWNRFFAPFQQGVPGLDAQAQLRFELPLARSGARGRLLLASGLAQRQRLLQADVDRAIRNGVTASFEGVRRSQLALKQSQEAVRLLEQTVENERQKFRLGFSTLFAVIQAEEQLTSALLSRISNQRSFAVSLARLRFETGTVLTVPGGGITPSCGQAVAAGLLLLP